MVEGEKRTIGERLKAAEKLIAEKMQIPENFTEPMLWRYALTLMVDVVPTVTLPVVIFTI